MTEAILNAKPVKANGKAVSSAGIHQKPMPQDVATVHPPAAESKPAGSKTAALDNDPGKTTAQKYAEIATSGVVGCVLVTHGFAEDMFKNDLDARECTKAQLALNAQVSGGDMVPVEALLMSQAVALNAVFVELSRYAAAQLVSKKIDDMDRFLRLAFKAQSQSRVTLESLAEIKNPRPVAFVKQANIANQQQVNNGVQPGNAGAAAQSLAADAPHAGGDAVKSKAVTHRIARAHGRSGKVAGQTIGGTQ